MDNYEKGETHEVEEPPVFTLADHDVHMRVTGGSKIRNLMGYAIKKIKEPGVRQMCWSGSAKAITKTVSCTEILKRKIKGLHQITKISYRRVEEYWDPKIEGLDRLKVNKDIPVISILLSKDVLDKNEPGYQSPGSFDEFWTDVVEKDKKTTASKQKPRSGRSTLLEGSNSDHRKKRKYNDNRKNDAAKKSGGHSNSNNKKCDNDETRTSETAKGEKHTAKHSATS